MHSAKILFTVFSLVACGAVVSHAQQPKGTHQLVPVFEKLKIERPIAVVIPPDGTKRMFLAQQRGKVVILPKDESSAEAPVFLDLSERKMEGSEQSKFEEGLDG